MTLAVKLANIRGALSQQATPRALIGLGLLLLIVAFASMTRFAEAVDEKQQTVRSLERQIAVRRSIAQESDWPERSDGAASLINAVESRFWVGETSGLVAAEIQTVLEAAARQAGLQNTRVNVLADPEPLIEPVVVLEAQLVASDRDGQFLALFDRLADEGRAIRITRFEWDRPNARIVLTLEAPAFLDQTRNNDAAPEAAS